MSFFIVPIALFMMVDSLWQLIGKKSVFDFLFGEESWRQARVANAITYLIFTLILLGSAIR